jgi:hypothetical protein
LLKSKEEELAFMKQEEIGSQGEERATPLSRTEQCQAEIDVKIVAIVENSAVADLVKRNIVVKEVSR